LLISRFQMPTFLVAVSGGVRPQFLPHRTLYEARSSHLFFRAWRPVAGFSQEVPFFLHSGSLLNRWANLFFLPLLPLTNGGLGRSSRWSCPFFFPEHLPARPLWSGDPKTREIYQAGDFGATTLDFLPQKLSTGPFSHPSCLLRYLLYQLPCCSAAPYSPFTNFFFFAFPVLPRGKLKGTCAF